MKTLLTALVAASILTGASPYPSPSLKGIPRYDLTVTVDPAGHRLAVTGTMRIPVTEARRSLTVSLNKAFRNVRFQVAGASVKPHGGYTDYLVTPARPFKAGSEVLLTFSYDDDGAVPAYGLSTDKEGAFASGSNVAWYPQLATPKWQPKGVGTLRFKLPVGHSVVASGRRIAPATFEVAVPTQLSFAAAHYIVARQGQVFVYTLTPRDGMEDYARKASRIIDIHSRNFGPYPFGEFDIVEVPEAQATRSGFSGQGEAGMIWVTPRFLTPAFNTAYYGHEIGHQWWGQLIEKDFDAKSGYYMPDEAVAQYGSLKAVREIEGEAAAERYRRTGYPNYIALQNALGVMTMARAGFKDTLDSPRGDVSHTVANSKGFLALEAMAEEIGHDRMRAILQGVAHDHAFGQLSWAQLKAALLKGGVPRDVLEQWSSRAGLPDWRLDGDAVVQSAPFYRATLEVDCGGRIVKVAISAARTKLPCRARALDPHFRVAHWTEEYRALADALVPYANWAAKDSYPQVHAELDAKLKALRGPDPYGLCFSIEYAQARVLIFEKKSAEARKHLEAALTDPNRRPDEVPWAYVRLAKLDAELGDRQAARKAAQDAIAADAKLAAPTGATVEAKVLLKP